MRHRLTILFLLCALASLVEGASISGVNYVPLRDWARDFGYKPQFHGALIRFTGARPSVTVEMGSHKAEIGGVTVVLSFPIAGNTGAPMISELDLRTTIEPI